MIQKKCLLVGKIKSETPYPYTFPMLVLTIILTQAFVLLIFHTILSLFASMSASPCPPGWIVPTYGPFE